MSRRLYEEDVVLGTCTKPGCTLNHRGQTMFVIANCHPESLLRVSFVYGDPDSFTVFCGECGREVCTVALASRVPREGFAA